MKTVVAAGLTLALALTLPASRARAADLAGDDQKIFYVLDHALARNIMQFDLSQEDVAIVREGLGDGVLGNAPRVELEKFGP